MEPFKELRTILRLWPYFKPHSKFANLKYGILIGSYSVCFLSSAWYSIFEANDFNEYVDCFLMSVTGLTFLASLIIFECRKTQLFRCFHDLEAILNERCTDLELNIMYSKTHELIETVTKNVYILLSIICIPILNAPMILLSFYSYLTSDCSGDSFQLGFAASFPFDIHAPMGYTVAWLVQLLNMFCMADIVLASPLLFTGVCMFSEDLVSDIEINLKRFEAKVIAPNKEQRVHKLASELIDILRFHARAKQFIEDFAETYRYTTFEALSYPIIMLCFPLLMFNMSLNNGDTNGVIHSFVLIVVIVNWTFIYCYVGDRLTSKFEHLGHSIYEIKWHLLPSTLQENLQLMIMAAQRPVYMDSFAGLRCTRPIFEMIIRNVYKTFMMLRQFGG